MLEVFLFPFTSDAHILRDPNSPGTFIIVAVTLNHLLTMTFTISFCYCFWGGMLILSWNSCRRGRFWWRVGSVIAISTGAPSCWELGFSSPWVEQSTPTWGLGSFSLDPISTLVLVCLQYFNISKINVFLRLLLLALGTSKVLHSLRQTYWNHV